MESFSSGSSLSSLYFSSVSSNSLKFRRISPAFSLSCLLVSSSCFCRNRIVSISCFLKACCFLFRNKHRSQTGEDTGKGLGYLDNQRISDLLEHQLQIGKTSTQLKMKSISNLVSSCWSLSWLSSRSVRSCFWWRASFSCSSNSSICANHLNVSHIQHMHVYIIHPNAVLNIGLSSQLCDVWVIYGDEIPFLTVNRIQESWILKRLT